MADMGWLGGKDAIDRLSFFRKAETILKYLHEIQHHFTWDEKQQLERVAELITEKVNQTMNSNQQTPLNPTEDTN